MTTVQCVVVDHISDVWVSTVTAQIATKNNDFSIPISNDPIFKKAQTLKSDMSELLLILLIVWWPWYIFFPCRTCNKVFYTSLKHLLE